MPDSAALPYLTYVIVMSENEGTALNLQLYTDASTSIFLQADWTLCGAWEAGQGRDRSAR